MSAGTYGIGSGQAYSPTPLSPLQRLGQQDAQQRTNTQLEPPQQPQAPPQGAVAAYMQMGGHGPASTAPNMLGRPGAPGVPQVQDQASRMAGAYNAVNGANGAIADPNRWATANADQQQQGALAQYFSNLATGQGNAQSLAALQQQQGQDAAIGALQSAALSNQGGNAPGLTQRNLLQATGQTQAQITQQGEQARLAEQQNAGQQAGSMYNNMGNQALQQQTTQGAQTLQGAGLSADTVAKTAQLGQNADVANAGNYLTNQGQGIQSQLGNKSLDQQQDQYQQQFDEQNSWWRKYALPGVSAGATVLGAALPGGK